jgi:hypothetical protein
VQEAPASWTEETAKYAFIRNGIPVADYPEQLAMMLAGMRQQERPDMDDITDAELVCRIGIMLLTLPGITEVDLNPVIYDPARNTFVAADARIRKS